MPVFHATPSKTTPAYNAIGQLHEALQALQSRHINVADFERFEQELHALFIQAERDVLADELAQLDVDVPRIDIEGVTHRRILRSMGTYTCAAGPIRAMRTLYRAGRVSRQLSWPV